MSKVFFVSRPVSKVKVKPARPRKSKLFILYIFKSECIKEVSVGKARETGISHESPI